MPGIFPFMQDFGGFREIRLLSDTHCYTPTGLKSSTTSRLYLHLPEVWPPAQYLTDAGLRPALARRLSSTYMEFVDRYRKTCQSHFDRATRGGGHLAEYYREVFVVLFKRTTQAWGSQIVSIVRVQLCQAGAFQATVRPERVDIRVDDAAKAEIIARLGLEATHLTPDRLVMVTNRSADVTSRLEEVSEQTHALSTDTVDSRLMLPGSPPVSGRYDPFSHTAPQTCFPAPYPPPPASCLPRNALPTSFIPPTPARDVHPLASHSPDMSTLTNLFERMTTTTQETVSRIPRSHGVFYISDSNRIKPLSPIRSPSIAANSTKSQLASEESIVSPTKPTNTPRRRKIASLPTRRGKTSASLSPPAFDSTEATSHPVTSRPTEQVVEVTPPDYVFAPLPNTHPVSTLPSLHTAEASYVGTPKSPTARQRKVHALHYKALPQSQTVPQCHLRPLARVRETLSYTVSRSPPLVSDATSYFDSPPTSSDELDTPPSTPPRSQVLLARTSTEGLAISSESDGIVFHKGPLGGAKLPNSRQQYVHLDLMKGGWGRDEQPLTFTFGV
ncbi:hypothetical protein EDB89DRAFT_1928373 [Lactarius sanguifluus]|nr:hypothetical protein EDB89DRAFT_1928373 [Lactarius sanguifluus]